MSNPYEDNRYRVRIIRHVDGDTSWVTADLGFDTSIKISIRWAGINAPEMGTAEGAAALAWVRTYLPEGERCLLTTVKDKREKFGRYLGMFWIAERPDVSVNQLMIDQGHAVVYDGGKR